MNFSNCSEKQLWEYVSTHLARAGVKSALVGGAVAAIYSKGAYKSGDLDIVIETFPFPKKLLQTEMEKLGFSKSGRHWIHSQCKHLFIEFCNPPIAIGDDFRIKLSEVKKNDVSIFILSPTDCVKDRLAGYIHWNARECLEQAALVAKSSKIDFDEIKKWCQKENSEGLTIYKELMEKIKN